MPLSINPSLSALRAFGKKQQVSANNIANSGSDGFKKSRLQMEESSNGGVTARTQPVNSPGVMVNQPDGSLSELSNVDLPGETVEMINTRHGYEANLKALQTDQEIEDKLLDLLG